MNSTETTGPVDALLEAMGTAGIDFSIEGTNSSGYWAQVALADDGYLMITAEDGAFTEAEMDDAAPNGWYVGRYNADGSQDDALGYVYASNIDAEDYEPSSDISEVIEAITAQVAAVKAGI